MIQPRSNALDESYFLDSREDSNSPVGFYIGNHVRHHYAWVVAYMVKGLDGRVVFKRTTTARHVTCFPCSPAGLLVEKYEKAS